MISDWSYVVIVTAIVVAAAVGASWRAWILKARYEPFAENAAQLERSEGRWRYAGHALATFSLTPLPALFFIYIDQLAAYAFVTFGAVAATGLLFVTKKAGGISLAKLWGGEVTVLNQIKLAVCGLFAGVLICVLVAFVLEPALRAALLKSVS